MSKFIIKAGPYGNEIVLGVITKELYEKYKDDSVALRKRVTTTGEPGDLNEWFDIDDRVNGPVAAAPVIDAAITGALAALKLTASALALAGFSQGGMMSLHCGLRHAAPPAAIVSFSGALLRHDDLADGASYPPVLLVHGTDDQIVPFALQSASYDVMQSRSIMVETVACDGLGHGIDPDGLSAAIAFLAKYLPA